MSQPSLHPNEKTMDLLCSDVEKEQISISKYASRLISQNASSSWPEGYWNDVYGCLKDDSFTVPEEIEGDQDRPLHSALTS